jgi:ABC-type multidrug transport system ATPase subunit
MMARTPFLAAEAVGKSFGGRRVLTSAALRAHTGEVTLVLGRNGAGKSTLLRIAAGWLAPDHGAIRFDDVVYTRPRLHHLARAGLFFLPDREIFAPDQTIREQLELVAGWSAGGGIDDVVSQLHLGFCLDRLPPTLSGGERRRAEFALALVRRPRCLIADEPLRGIDPRDTELLLETCRRLARDGCAVVISGHEVENLFTVADQVVWVTAGTSYQLGTPVEAAASEWFRREYLVRSTS